MLDFRLDDACPYCGGYETTAHKTEHKSVGFDGELVTNTDYFVECNHCGAATNFRGSEEDALDAWSHKDIVPPKSWSPKVETDDDLRHLAAIYLLRRIHNGLLRLRAVRALQPV